MLDRYKIKEYPSNFVMRHHCFTFMYGEIAMEALYDAMKLYGTMKTAKWRIQDPSVDVQMPDQLRKKVAIVITFSAMAAEAFINDYLAVRLGDDVFFQEYNSSRYHYYDKLDIILLDILRQWRHKTLPWYQDIRSLFELRNDYVHSSSYELSPREFIDLTYYDTAAKERAIARLNAAQGEFPENNVAQMNAVICSQNGESPEEWVPRLADTAMQKELRRDLDNAKFALTALCNMTRAIQKLDPKSRAFTSMFSPSILMGGDCREKEIRMEVFPVLGLKLKKVDS